MNHSLFAVPCSAASMFCRSTVLCVVMAIGCGRSGTPYPVKTDVAQKTLVSTMESWKEGKTPDSLQKASPSVVVQDMEWASGAKLLAYEVLDGAKAVDANLIAKVKLKLTNASGKEMEKTVTYVVGTAPKLTVFRDIMH